MGVLSSFLYVVLFSNWLWITVLLLTLYWIYMCRMNAYYDTSSERTDDKTFVITGAETGIGKAAVNLLADRGGRIIMACKDVTLGEATRNEVVNRTKNQNLEVKHLDLASLESVRKFSAEIHKSLDRVDVLINNASSSCVSSPTTVDGLNTIMQVNYFGPFLLTNLLLDLLKKSAPSRIVFVSSIFHHFHKFSLDNINCDKETLPGCRVYFNSKLANILTSRYFARMLLGTGVSVNSLHPGIVKPDPTTNETCSGSIVGRLYNTWRSIFGKTFAEGAMTTTYAATDPKLTYVTGHHFSECKISSCLAKITGDEILQEHLYEKTSQLVKLRPEERHL